MSGTQKQRTRAQNKAGSAANNAEKDNIEESGEDFASKLVDALLDPRVIDSFKTLFSSVIEDFQKKVTSMEKSLEEKDKQICKLTEELDDMKQTEKRNCVRIDGVQESSDSEDNENTGEVISRLFSDKLKIPCHAWEIESAFRVGKKGNAQKPRRIIMRFISHDKKRKVMAAKKNLRSSGASNNQVYINDDLTQARSAIFQQARQGVKDKKIHRTWVYQGQIFVKCDENDNPVIVKTLSKMNAILASQ